MELMFQAFATVNIRSQLPDLEAKFFQLDPVHPAIYKRHNLYLTGYVLGDELRLHIKDYRIPPEKTLVRDLTAKLSIDSHAKLGGKLLLRRLVEKGLSCTYTHINVVSYIMHEVTQLFLSASSVLSNETVYSGVGTACIAMVASAFCIPVIVCCEAYKLHEKVQHDSICSNELGDPDVISTVRSREDVNHLEAWANTENPTSKSDVRHLFILA
ncbi:hypothetical protein RJT34_18509 [Clitoria ternatea]|uniref:Translation initiation factor eIF2B subunit delta n=1 Tax=Clitoria ternatea TaxID=43366 RepID=A0AAN9JB81_CLITE